MRDYSRHTVSPIINAFEKSVNFHFKCFIEEKTTTMCHIKSFDFCSTVSFGKRIKKIVKPLYEPNNTEKSCTN